MSDDAEQTPTTPTPQLFARAGGSVGQRPAAPAAPASTQQDPVQDASGRQAGSRFPSTGDARVDQALAHLPDPGEHDRDRATGTDDLAEEADAPADDTDAADGDDVAADGFDLPDPTLLDSHVADVTSVHRQLQQRLSDLSS